MFVLMMLALLTAPDQPDFDPATGYRIAHYRGVVPQAPDGIRRIDTSEAARLSGDHAAVFIDVTPAEGGQRSEIDGRWHLAMPHDTIARAHWFPDTGRGVLTDGMESWLLRGMSRLTRRDLAKPVVVFCLADCWMSWNAARRLHLAGYENVLWYAEGIDGWREFGLRLAHATPEKYR